MNDSAATGGERARTDHPARIGSAASEHARIQLTAEWILDVFDDFYADFLQLTWTAKAAFESRDPATAVANARRRLGLYNATVYPLADELQRAFPQLKEHE
ncbi:MAG TPA: isocitrate dehydrogenase kinase/phosphatase AceK regulatory subunit, partial [Steroidobacteraceae bacterium]